MKRGQISVIGLVMFIVLALFFIYAAPAFIGMVNIGLGSGVDLWTGLLLLLIIPTIFYALISGFWNSVNTGG